jgi:hypothetical protein
MSWPNTTAGNHEGSAPAGTGSESHHAAAEKFAMGGLQNYYEDAWAIGEGKPRYRTDGPLIEERGRWHVTAIEPGE